MSDLYLSLTSLFNLYSKSASHYFLYLCAEVWVKLLLKIYKQKTKQWPNLINQGQLSQIINDITPLKINNYIYKIKTNMHNYDNSCQNRLF